MDKEEGKVSVSKAIMIDYCPFDLESHIKCMSSFDEEEIIV